MHKSFSNLHLTFWPNILFGALTFVCSSLHTSSFSICHFLPLTPLPFCHFCFHLSSSCSSQDVLTHVWAHLALFPMLPPCDTCHMVMNSIQLISSLPISALHATLNLNHPFFHKKIYTLEPSPFPNHHLQSYPYYAHISILIYLLCYFKSNPHLKSFKEKIKWRLGAFILAHQGEMKV